MPSSQVIIDPKQAEISVRDCLDVLVEKKRNVLLIISLCLFVFFVISLLLSPKYRVSTIIKPAEISQFDASSIEYIDNVANMQSLINPTMDMKVAQSLHLDAGRYLPLKLQKTLKKNTNFIVVSYVTSNIKMGKTILGQVILELEDNYKHRLKKIANTYKARVHELTNKIKDIKADKKVMMAKDGFFNNEIRTIGVNKQKLKNKIKSLDIEQDKVQTDIEKSKSQLTKLDNDIELLKLEQKDMGILREQYKEEMGFITKQSVINKNSLVKLDQELLATQKNSTIMRNSSRRSLTDATRSNKNSLAVLMYSNTVQQNLALMDKMNTKQDGLLERIEKNKYKSNLLRLKGEKIGQSIEKNKIEIKNIQSKQTVARLSLAELKLKINQIELEKNDLAESNNDLNVQIDNKKIEQGKLINQAVKYDSLSSNYANKINRLNEDINGLRSVDIIVEPMALAKPVSPGTIKLSLLGFVLGCCLAFVYLFVLILMRNNIISASSSAG